MTARSTSSGLLSNYLQKTKSSFFIPRGFSHGFVTLTDHVEFFYKAENYFAPEADGDIRWNDLEIGIKWGNYKSYPQ